MNIWEIFSVSPCWIGFHDWRFIKGWDDPEDESGHTRTDRDVCQRCGLACYRHTAPKEKQP